MTIAVPSLVTRTSEGKERFPFLSHRTVAEIYGPNLELMDRRSRDPRIQRRKG